MASSELTLREVLLADCIESTHELEMRELRERIAELEKALYRPGINEELLRTVAQKPIVVSLLYDIDLLPEQLASQENMTIGLFAAYNRLEGILLAFKALEMAGVILPAPERS